MKQFEVPYLELILLKGDVIVTSGETESETGDQPGESSGNFNP